MIIIKIGIFGQRRLSEQHIKHIRNYFSARPVKKAYLFGSYSRNEADENSDIDILVELDPTEPIGLKFFSFQPEFEKILKRKVDLVSYEGFLSMLNPLLTKKKC